MNPGIKNFIGGCLLAVSICTPLKTLAAKTIALEPNQSPPINAGNYFVRAEVYNPATMYIKNGITILIKLGQTPEDTYLNDSSGVDKEISLEVNCRTGDGLITGTLQNYIPAPANPKRRFNLFKTPNDPYATAISFACSDFLKHATR